MSCKKEDGETKIEVCHQNQKDGSSHTITINENALPAHLAHGDVLGPCFETVTICNQVWMLKNLDVDRYRDGTPIPLVTTDEEWIAAGNAETGAWCYYNNDPSTGATYGKLYNWYAVNDPRGLAPAGWHIPSDAEWTTLESCLNQIEPSGNVGGKLKEAGTTHWQSPNTGATNSSGFTALPGGHRFVMTNGSFFAIGQNCEFWSSTENGTFGAWQRLIFYFEGDINRFGGFKPNGISVRCVRD